jgi:hypothetical protein
LFCYVDDVIDIYIGGAVRMVKKWGRKLKNLRIGMRIKQTIIDFSSCYRMEEVL